MGSFEDYPQHNFAARPLPEPKLLRQRFRNFQDGRYKEQNLSSVLYHHRSGAAEHVQLECWSAPGQSKPPFEEAKKHLDAGEGKPIDLGFQFGPSWTNHWVKVTLTIPAEWSKYEQVQLLWDMNGESLVFDESGLALQGLTGDKKQDARWEYIIPRAEVKAGCCVRYLECSANHMFGCGHDPMRGMVDANKYYELALAEIVVPNLDAWALKYDFDCLRQLSDTLPEQSPLGNKARKVANEVMNAFDGTVASIPACRKIAEQCLGHDYSNALLKSRDAKGADSDGQVFALGHCHIDTAWLWPWSVTQQKVARSWSTQIDLMDRYPEHRFVATSAQQYKWLEQLYPRVFKRLQEKVKAGQFEYAGGTWLECDTNMPSGESLCRQFLLGQKFFKSRFGKPCDVLVLPDTFGYVAQLPQLARLAGCTSFFTQKLSWNATNTFPLTTFNWVGLDGSEVLTHMTPAVNYNSQCGIDDIRKCYTNHRNLDAAKESMLLFGNGDGGGGPTPPMLEKLRRARAVGETSDASGAELPKIRMGGTMSGFFDHVREETNNGQELPDWNGELYLEYHRGTYTSQTSTKRGNRKGENLLRDVEYFATLASISTDYKYPAETIESLWEDLCRNQFHDTLPGSVIDICVKDSDEKFAGIQATGKRLVEEALAALGCSASADSGEVVVINPVHAISRQEIVPSPKQGEGLVIAHSAGDSVALTNALPSSPVQVQLSKDGFTLSNATISLTVREGRIAELVDVQLGRSLIPSGRNGGFNLYEDHPDEWDAWDVEYYHLEKGKPLFFDSYKVVHESPLRVTVACRMAFGASTATVNITLDGIGASPRPDSRGLVRFDLDVDWHEDHKFFKFELPTTVWAPEATYDAAFGVVRRPTHRNTTWDSAKFEVCGHKFADLSEYGYGVALVTEAKYGYAVQGNVMRLSLLRSPTAPHATCDRGKQNFSFAVYPHVGTFGESDVPEVAHAFNNPLMLRYGTPSPLLKKTPFSLTGATNVLLETIKRGEADFDALSHRATGGKTVILRLFEHKGGAATVNLNIHGLEFAAAHIVNIVEDELKEVPLERTAQGSVLKLAFTAFQIQTVKLTMG